MSFDAQALHRALVAKFRVSATTGWKVVLPAIPSMVEEYVTIWEMMLKPQGWKGTTDVGLRATLEYTLDMAWKASPRSRIVLTWQSDGDELHITHTAPSVVENYEGWLGFRGLSPFGLHADARVWLLAEELSAGARDECRVLDVGAGTGRNALALARFGYLVDAVEVVPKFAEQIRTNAQKWDVATITVFDCDAFATNDLRDDYTLIFASEVTTDFLSVTQLRALFELGAKRLLPGGRLLFSAFVTKDGWTPSQAARELGTHFQCTMFTPDDLAWAGDGLALERIADDSVYDYEKAHLPEEAWPPTNWFPSWTTGRDLFRGEGAEECPIELRWLVYERAY